jgi:integrase
MKVIKKALKEAVRLGILPRDPSSSIELLSENTEERGILTPDEVTELARFEWADERSKIASILGAVSSMRISEVVELRIENVNADKNVIVVDRSYSYYEKRLIPIDAPTFQRILALCGKRSNGFILCGTEGKQPVDFNSLEPKAAKS